MVVGSESQGIGSGYGNMTAWEARLEGDPVRDCLWIIAPKALTQPSPSPGSAIQLRIPADLNVTCENNAVYVYDALPDVVLASASHHSHALGTFCRRGDTAPFVVESYTGTYCLAKCYRYVIRNFGRKRELVDIALRIAPFS